MIKKTTKKVAPKSTAKSTNLIIIDASGSMGDKIEEAKGGLKQLLTDIKKDAKKSKIGTIVVDFSSGGDFNVLLNTKDSKDIDPTIGDNYRTRGMTALFDAVGKGFALVDEKEKNVFVTIITDGLENDSKEFNNTSISALVDKQKKKGWALTFMGTTDAALSQAGSWGIPKGNMFKFSDSKKGVGQSMTMTSNARNAYYSMTTNGVNGANGMAGYRGTKGENLTATMDTLLQSQVDQGADLDLDLDKDKKDGK